MPTDEELATTIDARLQEAVAGIISSRRDELELHGAHNVAVVVLDNNSGEWLAWEGSGNYFDSAHGGATLSARARMGRGARSEGYRRCRSP